jgi:eukaryotic-like serine/threonine-protein kinase
MTLASGTKLGPYEILSPIGAGGMGEVYRARDPRVGRDVAIKVSSEQFTDRFTREVHAVAALNHSNVCTLFDVGPNYLVMELVEGPTLADRIKQGPIPLEESLEIARQIADALEAAHEKGIVHRDLKPGNIKIRPDGTVKVLDFGLAKFEETAAISLETSPTLSVAQTGAGVLLGTAAYMSPEQARGKSVDKRSDIWAFGVVVYEMVTGSQLFSGETVSDTLAAVLTKEPEFDEVPARFRPLLRSCLIRDPKNRLRDIGSVAALLEAVSETELKPAAVKSARTAWICAAIATAIMILLAVPAFLYFRTERTPKLKRYHLALPPMSDDHSLTVSPDGRSIAFLATSTGTAASLYLRDIGSLNPRKINGTEGASYPFWSADSVSIGFFQKGRLKTLHISSGSIRDICGVSYTIFGPGSWNRDGVIVFTNVDGSLYRVSEEGREPVAITALDKSRETAHVLPYFLPDGLHFLFVSWSGTGHTSVYIGSLGSEAPRELVPETTTPAYAEPGYLLFQREKTLFAQPFGASSLELSGKPVPIVENLLRNKWGFAGFSISQDGLLLYRDAADQTGSRFVWFDRKGEPVGTAGKPAPYAAGFRLSPDEKQLAASLFDPVINSLGAWLVECGRDVPPARLCTDALCILPAWSPDGSQIAFSSSRKGNYDIFVRKMSGGKDIPFVESPDQDWLKDWSRDGRYLAYAKKGGLYAMPLTGEKRAIPIVESSFALNTPAFSFDGKWVAFTSEESGMAQVYVLPFPSEGLEKKPISTNGGIQPRWRNDSRELYYLALDGKMMAVDIMVSDGIKPGQPRELFDTGLSVHPDDYQYDVTADGRRFILLKPVVAEKQTLVPVVTNWTSLLQK